MFVVRFGEFTDQFFKDIAHIGGGDFVRGHIALFGAELLQGHKQNAALYHQLDRIGKVKVFNNILYVRGKPLQIGVKVAFHVVRVCHQLGKVKVAGIIEIPLGDLAQNAVAGLALDLLLVQLSCHFHNGIFGGLQGIVKAFQHRHRQNDLAVFVGLEQAYQMGGNVPNQVGFCLYIRVCLVLQFLH